MASGEGTDDRLYFRQLLAGRDIAVGDPLAVQMVNFVYLIGDRATGEALVVDPAYDPAGLLSILERDGLRLVGVLGTHYHPDHLGGDLMGRHVAGVAELLGLVDVPVHVQLEEVPWVQRVTGLGAAELIGHRSGDRVPVGELEVELVHTPGHTPGSQCFAVAGRLISGDTLFLDGCGRTDLPGGDPEALYESLTTRLARFPDGTVLYPGHRYSPASAATLGSVREHNVVFRVQDPGQWLAMFGGR